VRWPGVANARPPVTLLGPLCAFASSVTWAFASGKYAQKAGETSGARVNCARALFAWAGWSAAVLVTSDVGAGGIAQLSVGRVFLLMLSIVCSYVVGDGVFYAAAQRAGVSSALAVATVYPLWAALYGALVRGETLGPLRAAGLLGCVLGVALLLRQAKPQGTARVFPQARLGIALALLTSLFWAGNAVFLKEGAEGLPVVQTNAVRFGVGVLLLGPRVYFERATGPRTPMLLLVRQLWLPLVLDTLLGSVCYVYGLAHSSLALGVTLSSLSPLAALPIAVASGTERVTLARAACVLLIVASVVALVLG